MDNIKNIDEFAKYVTMHVVFAVFLVDGEAKLYCKTFYSSVRFGSIPGLIDTVGPGV